MAFPAHLVPPQRQMTREAKSILLLKAVADNNQDEITRLRLIDWDIDNIYSPDEMDVTGTKCLPPAYRVNNIGKRIPLQLNVQKMRGVRDLVNNIMPIVFPRRRMPAESTAKYGGGNVKDNAHIRSLIHRKVEYLYSGNNFVERRQLRQLLLGHKVKINYDAVRRALCLEKMTACVALLPWNIHYNAWITTTLTDYADKT